jgi:hypothetical protein
LASQTVRRNGDIDVVARRFGAQLLAGDRAADAAGVAERLLAVQAQDLRSARLAVRARTSGLTAADVDRQLDEGRLVVGWLNRGTLHLVCREDYWWLHGLTTPPLFPGNARRLSQTGVSSAAAERGVAAIARALERDGPLTRDELRERVEAVRVPTAGQALVHLLMLACLRGLAVRGPFKGTKHAYVLAAAWLGPPPRVERDTALAELARRYLCGHAPADDRDLAKWSGLPLRDARAGLAAVTEEEAAAAADAGPPLPCLLDQWDPVLVGWASREPRKFRPYAWVGGRTVATWSARAGEIKLEPFARLRRAERTALDADAADVARFLARY